MAKNANIRFDDANVAYVSVDDTTHEMTGGVMDETTGTFYPVGGGGTEITNPILTINVDASGVVGDIGALPLIQLNDGSLQNIAAMVVGGSSYSYDTIVLDYYDNGDSAYFWDGSTAYPSITGYVGTLSVSDEVNIAVTLSGGTFYGEITDPTEPASFTLTVS